MTFHEAVCSYRTFDVSVHIMKQVLVTLVIELDLMFSLSLFNPQKADACIICYVDLD